MEKQAVILAGGKGSRLAPYTTVLPKPLLPVGDRAILDVVVRQLASYGFQDITLAVGYLAHLVQAVFADGADRGVSIRYHEEDTPLGTAGALASVEALNGTPFLVMNGDVLTALDYSALYESHIVSENVLTIATHARTIHIDYGVLHVDRNGYHTDRVTNYEEKPEIGYTVSMGVYVASPRVLEYIEPGKYLDLPELVLRLIEAGEQVGSFHYEGFWLDIGRHEDYERAIDQYEELKSSLVPGSD
jgi:NDP-sugar pyrophosphorylase family protein